MMARWAAALALLAGAHVALGAWQTAPGGNGIGKQGFPIAFTTNERGHRAEIFQDGDGQVYLRFVRQEGLLSFAPGSCPTFQIDQRKPMHYYEVGEQCRIEDKEVTIVLGRILDNRITSLVLYRLMNGRQVAFRYTTKDGAYHESRFKLNNSKQVVKNALGARTRILPE